MTQVQTEWTIVADAKSWMDALLERHGSSAPFESVKLETRTSGSLKRRDLTILDRHGAVALTGEVKVPYAHDGASPFVESTIVDARQKAIAARAPWFFTWNLNELVLWRTDSVGDIRAERGFKSYSVTLVRRQRDLDDPRVQRELRDGIERFLLDFMRLFTGQDEVQRRPPDAYFVNAFDSFLTLPILNATEALIIRDASVAARTAVNSWMRDVQGWTLVGDRSELLSRAARFAVYAVANKLVFYDALRKRYSSLPPLEIDPAIDSGEGLVDALSAFFDTAREETGDYETIFGPAASDIGSRIPFYESSVVDGWRQFARQIDRFDLSQLDYDVIGRIFERLIDPTERHKYGQYYTRPEVVDLINAFAIREGSDLILDPGCGGGTFLVRAYARKRRLAPRLGHAALLETIYGTDVSPFAANLSTINLATRDLIEDANYPRVARADFFGTAVGAPLLRLPAAGGGSRSILMPRFDAIVGNPPYVRQEDVLAEDKARYSTVARASGLPAGGRSDLHVYFWGHALSLLTPKGRLGFLASSQWLDAEYGFALQAFLLENFRIEAIIESRNEPWFVGARVATVATVCVRDADPAARDANCVRFVELSRPIADLLASDGTSQGALEAAEQFRDQILGCTADVDNEGWRVRVEQQGDIRRRGERLGERTKGKPVYAGDKWGIPLRAPVIWNVLLQIGGERWRPLAELAEVARGITSGCDAFFYVDDWSAEGLRTFPDSGDFLSQYGAPRSDVAAGTIVLARSGSGEVHPIERVYLQPIVHSLMNVDRYVIEDSNRKGMALMVSDPIEDLAGTYVARYIAWGDRMNFSGGSTVAQRGRSRPWYDLTNYKRAIQLWSKSHQYRHCAPINPTSGPVNCNLYTVTPRELTDQYLVAGVLNSSVTLLAKHLFGRPAGVEGNLKTEIVDVNMMPVPDWTQGSKGVKRRIISAMTTLASRDLAGLLSPRRLRRKSLVERGRANELSALSDATELDMPDRQALDEAVLELLGLGDAIERRAVRDRLYDHLRGYFEDKRVQEEEAIDNKRQTAAARTLGPKQVAADVFSEIERDHQGLRRTYLDLTRGQARGDGVRIPSIGEPRIIADLVTLGVRFGERGGSLVIAHTAAQAELIAAIASVGPRGRSVFVPREAPRVQELTERVRAIAIRRARVVRELVEARTTDPEIVEAAVSQVLARLLVPVTRAERSVS